MEHYSVTKSGDTMPFPATRVDPEIILSQRKPSRRITHTRRLKHGTRELNHKARTDREKRLLVAGGAGWGREELEVWREQMAKQQGPTV